MRVRRNADPVLVGALHSKIMPWDDLPKWTQYSAGWIVYDGKQPVGFAVARQLLDPQIVYLERAGVFPQYAGAGIQRRLIRARVRWAAEIGAQFVLTYTVPDNWPSMVNLLRCGFKAFVPAYRWAGKDVTYWRLEL